MTIKLIDCQANSNVRDGLRIGGQTKAYIRGFRATGNGGQGINIVSDGRRQSWHERTLGAIAVGLLAGVSLEALKRAIGLS